MIQACSHRLARSRTPGSHPGNWGSNPHESASCTFWEMINKETIMKKRSTVGKKRTALNPRSKKYELMISSVMFLLGCSRENAIEVFKRASA